MGEDVFTVPVKILLFFLSYVPLYIIFIILNHQNQTVFWFFIIFSIIVVVLSILLYFLIKSISGTYLAIDKAENINKINMEYLVIYLLPFLNINFNDVYANIALSVFFFIIGFIYVNSDMLYTNPTLNLLGFSVFKCYRNTDELIIIARKGKAQLGRNKVIQIGSNIYLER